jgi:hypothetical protein
MLVDCENKFSGVKERKKSQREKPLTLMYEAKLSTLTYITLILHVDCIGRNTVACFKGTLNSFDNSK